MDLSTGVSQKRIDDIFAEVGLDGPKAGQIRKFCVAYVDLGYNGSEAAKAAGYEGERTAQRAYEYQQDQRVRRAIALLAIEFSKSNPTRVDFVLRKMIKGAERAEAEGNLSAMARFVEMIGKHLGMFKEQVELSGKDGKAIEIEQRNSEDVAAFKASIDGLAKRGVSSKKLPDTKH